MYCKLENNGLKVFSMYTLHLYNIKWAINVFHVNPCTEQTEIISFQSTYNGTKLKIDCFPIPCILFFFSLIYSPFLMEKFLLYFCRYIVFKSNIFFYFYYIKYKNNDFQNGNQKSSEYKKSRWFMDYELTILHAYSTVIQYNENSSFSRYTFHGEVRINLFFFVIENTKKRIKIIV